MKEAVACLLLFIVVGCDTARPAPAPVFRDKEEERNYLESLSNPTLDQFRRREELRDQKAFDDAGKNG